MRVVSSYNFTCSDKENIIMIAGSGGGSFASAILFYLLKELDQVSLQKSQSLLDQVALISAVSGSTVTAMDYVLKGRSIFKYFESSFLHQNVIKQIMFKALKKGVSGLKSVLFSSYRTELMIDYFNSYYNNASYQDLIDRKGQNPFLIVNTTPLEMNCLFAFTQNYFSLIGQDLSQISCGQAVGIASSIAPVTRGATLKNEPTLNRSEANRFVERFLTDYYKNNHPYMYLSFLNYKKLLEEGRYPYLHLIDGAYTDTTGLFSLILELLPGGAVYQKIQQKKVKKIGVFAVCLPSVNKLTKKKRVWGRSSSPCLGEGGYGSLAFHMYKKYVQQVMFHLLDNLKYQYGIETYFIRTNFYLLDEKDYQQALHIPKSYQGLTKNQTSHIQHCVQDILEKQRSWIELKSSFIDKY